MTYYKLKKLQHDLFHMERAALNAVEAMRKINKSLPDSVLYDFEGQIDVIIEKISHNSEETHKRILGFMGDGRRHG